VTSLIVAFDDAPTADLVRGALYEGGSAPNVAAEVIHHLLPVGNRGGIRFAGSIAEPSLVALQNTGKEVDWPDTIEADGAVTYYGDNRKPQGPLEKARRGNQMLRAIANSGIRTRSARLRVPPFFIFTTSIDEAPPWSVRFEGLLVPGRLGEVETEWLTTETRRSTAGTFENYVFRGTLLDTDVVSRVWIDGFQLGRLTDDSCPGELRSWIETGC